MKRKAGDAGADDRLARFATELRNLNKQFAGWIAQQASDHPGELWLDGVEDYQAHLKSLMKEYADVMDQGEPRRAAARAAARACMGANRLRAGGGGGAGRPPPANCIC
jgi:nuclear pore complex protein Nup50